MMKNKKNLEPFRPTVLYVPVGRPTGRSKHIYPLYHWADWTRKGTIQHLIKEWTPSSGKAPTWDELKKQGFRIEKAILKPFTGENND